MGTIMLIQSKATKSVKPDIVEVGIDITERGKLAKEVIDLVNRKREQAKNYMLTKESTLKDSYTQTNISIRKITNRKYYYTKGDKSISEEEYSKLSFELQREWERQIKDEFLCYSANLHMGVELSYGETVVNDLVGIYNMALENDMRCTYRHTISEQLEREINNDLFIECVNQGITDVDYIICGINSMNKENVKLLKIVDTNVSDDRDYGMRYSKSACLESTTTNMYEPENIMMPELIADVFENTIELSRSIDMTFEV